MRAGSPAAEGKGGVYVPSNRRSVPSAPSSVLSAGVLLASISAWAIVTDLANVANVHAPVGEHVEQADLNALPVSERFIDAFEIGDELFATAFNAIDGGGANVGRGQRYTRVPRADLRGRGEWFTHTPISVTGPNAGGCFECHEQPFEDGAGTAALNVHRDPFRTGHDRPVRRAQHAARLRARRDPAARRGDDRRPHRRPDCDWSTTCAGTAAPER